MHFIKKIYIKKLLNNKYYLTINIVVQPSYMLGVTNNSELQIFINNPKGTRRMGG